MDTKDLCLGVLSLGAASGYDIRRQLEQTFAHFMEISPSGVYPALKQLASEGLATTTVVPQSGKPNKIVYALTDEGRKALRGALAECDGRHKVRSEMLAMMFFADLAPPAKLKSVLLARSAELEGFIAETKAWRDSGAIEDATPGQRFLAGYALAVMEAEAGFLRSHFDALIGEVDETTSRTAPSGAKRA
ncbi:MAG: PadR family transcriptional regulator [Blastochloris sp.]|nr:PadR family transcriptional regulator [Blastochloris sp.]